MTKKKVPIKYSSREFNTIKQDLVEYAKRYYSDTYKDFNESGFGPLMMDITAYIGDILSFYLDYQTNESFIDTALEYNNVIRHGKPLGYKFRGNPSSYGIATFYIIVPAAISKLGPDSNYIPVLLRGSEFATDSGNGFILNEDVNFADSKNEIVVAAVDENTGVPVSYAIKAHGQVISGEINIETIDVGDFQRFLRLPLLGTNITEVISVVDSEGHEYFEVEFLSQDVIYKALLNRNIDADYAPNILKPITVPRRFVVEQERNVTYLQFGYGSNDEIKDDSVVDPSKVIMKVYGKDYITDDTFDPTNLISTDKFGVAPSNTTLSIVTRNNSSLIVNAAVNSLTSVVNPLFEFSDITSLNPTQVSEIIASLELTNETAIIGDVTYPDSDELRRRIYDTFATQNRAVTREDYMSIVYRMPPKFGAIKRCSIIQDHDSFKRNLNLYVISEDAVGNLITTSDTIKSNLKTWLLNYKMINDTIDILDAKIVNFGVEFEAIADEEQNKYVALSDAISELKSLFKNKFDISEPLSITDIFFRLKQVDNIVDVVKVKIVKKTGGNYSDIKFDIDQYTSPDGRYVGIPENCIFELKYPNVDLIGSIK